MLASWSRGLSRGLPALPSLAVSSFVTRSASRGVTTYARPRLLSARLWGPFAALAGAFPAMSVAYSAPANSGKQPAAPAAPAPSGGAGGASNHAIMDKPMDRESQMRMVETAVGLLSAFYDNKDVSKLPPPFKFLCHFTTVSDESRSVIQIEGLLVGFVGGVMSLFPDKTRDLYISLRGTAVADSILTLALGSAGTPQADQMLDDIVGSYLPPNLTDAQREAGRKRYREDVTRALTFVGYEEPRTIGRFYATGDTGVVTNLLEIYVRALAEVASEPAEVKAVQQYAALQLGELTANHPQLVTVLKAALKNWPKDWPAGLREAVAAVAKT